MDRRTFLSLLPSIPLVPRLLEGEEIIQLPPPSFVSEGTTFVARWQESISQTFPPIDITKHRDYEIIKAKGWLDTYWPQMVKDLKVYKYES